METTPLRSKILDTIIRKSTLKQRVFDNTFAAFNELKETLFEMASEMDDELDGKLDRRVRLEYRDRGKFEAQLQVANDILIFQMHTDVFEFDANHLIWQNPYVQSDRENSYCGLINIYNFLSDSFKFNRNADEGYLIGRIFINRERRYFVDKIRALNPDYERLYQLRPGLFSPATLYNGYADTMEKMLERLRMDLDYLERRSLWLDMGIVARTVAALLAGRKL